MNDNRPLGEELSEAAKEKLRQYMAEAAKRHDKRNPFEIELSGLDAKLPEGVPPVGEEILSKGTLVGDTLIVPGRDHDDEEINMEPDPRYAYHPDDEPINMEPDPRYAYHPDGEEINMEPDPRYAFRQDDDEEINMEPAPEFVSYDVEPEMDMRPAKQFTSPTISLVEFKTKYPSFFDENGNIRTEALEIIDGLLEMFMKAKKGDTDTQHMEREYIVEPKKEQSQDRDRGHGLGM